MVSDRSPSRIRVLSVIARMNVGGPALEVVHAEEGLDRQRFDHQVLTGRVAAGEADYLALRAPTAKVRYINGLGRSIRIGGDVRAYRALGREVRAFLPHIVHTHTAKAGVLGRLAAFRQGEVATVHTFHGHLLHGYFSRAGTQIVIRAERALARRTTKLVAVGGAVRDELLSAGIGTREQFVVIPPGVEELPCVSRDDARHRLGLPRDVPVVAFVARLTQVKRPDRFLSVAQRVRAELPETVFVVAGEGDDLERTRMQASQMGLSANVRFLGWRSDVEVVYSAADATMLTSDNEGTPVSLIEAAMAGCPAVTTDVGSAREVVMHERTGFVTGLDADDVAAGLLRVLGDDRLRARFAAAAAAHARQAFSRERLLRDLATLYEGLAAGRGAVSLPS